MDAPLSQRIVAALAIGEMQDAARIDEVVKPLLKTFPNHPDVVRAGVGVGLLPPEALKRIGR
jgi:hypothetical protein